MFIDIETKLEALEEWIKNIVRVSGLPASELLTGIEEMRKDAERYRFLCDPGRCDYDKFEYAMNALNAWQDKNYADLCVDDAIKSQTQHINKG